ncbi:ATP-binding protein [Sphingobium sufflavum]|uniref:ATP-binding protein n=1 Tax=Sphingobium sufflavum TaxID=1129547 RepID=UPI001F42BDB2|nr:ATP-binding protein [Sphingobium sufflavum]MCE7797199.1 ATP-binding protein [Sphingobium sufflavum]
MGNPRSLRAPSVPDAGWRNMELLVQLRWIAVGGQLITIAVVQEGMRIDLRLLPLMLAPAVLALVNVATMLILRRRRRSVSNGELTAALLLDVAALAWQLYHSGGLTNPFASLFLLQVVIGAILLRPRSSWGIVAAALAALALLAVESRPLALPTAYAADPLGLYIRGSLVCFALIAVLLVLFVARIARNLQERDAALAAIRQRAVEEDHIVRMGLLASGAAHELGTPLASLSVLIGDWRDMDRFDADPEMQEDLADMAAAVHRCKTIVSGILMSAGEARGTAPEFTTVRRFLHSLVAGWPAAVLDDDFGEDVAIVSDPALRQVIANALDNAAEVSPGWIGVAASRDQDRLILTITDHGPGFAAEILAGFGQPYRSTKGKPGGGLGLFLLVNMVRKLGGEASASNRAEGGAMVRVTLPLDSLSYHLEAPQ